jgi:predicted dehydrogenase
LLFADLLIDQLRHEEDVKLIVAAKIVERKVLKSFPPRSKERRDIVPALAGDPYAEPTVDALPIGLKPGDERRHPIWTRSHLVKCRRHILARPPHTIIKRCFYVFHGLQLMYFSKAATNRQRLIQYGHVSGGNGACGGQFGFIALPRLNECRERQGALYMSKIVTAFVGVAHIHTPGFIGMLNRRAEAGDVAVKYVWDPQEARARQRAGELPGSEYVGDVETILSDPAISAVVICSETSLHKDLVLAAAARGKHIYCEKPIGLGAKDANAMADAIEAAGVTFQTGFASRSSSVHQFIKREVAAGNLGKLTRAHYSNGHNAVLQGWFDTEWHWLAEPKLAGGGALLDLGAHPLDLILNTFSATEGAVASAHGAVGNRVGRYGTEIDEYGTGLIQFESGFSATVEASWVETGPHSLPTAVLGTEGQIFVKDGGVYYSTSKIEGFDGKSPVPAELLPPAAPHAFELFWDVLLGREISVPLVSVREAALGSAVMERIYNSAGKSTVAGA